MLDYNTCRPGPCRHTQGRNEGQHHSKVPYPNWGSHSITEAPGCFQGVEGGRAFLPNLNLSKKKALQSEALGQTLQRKLFYFSLLDGSDGKESAYIVGHLGLIPESGRSPREGNGNTLQYSCLVNPVDRGAWWATVHGVAKSQTWPLKRLRHT